MKAMWVRILAAFLCLWAGGAAAQAIRVIDGDTFDLGETRIRLLDIDAPEMGQSCRDARGRSYRCGEASANALGEVLAMGRVRCEGRENDQYGRRLARCSVAGQDVGALMVLSGEALAFVKYSDHYLPQQIDAQKAGRGVWRGRFTAPWDYRAGEWQQAAAEGPRDGCPIKGNINAKGERIYHTPYSRHYHKTRINTRKGERWFCDEAEALAAGWRAPR